MNKLQIIVIYVHVLRDFLILIFLITLICITTKYVLSTVPYILL